MIAGVIGSPLATTALQSMETPSSRAPRRILHLLAPGEVGGMESVVRLLARGQHMRGDRPVVVSVIESSAHARTFRDALAADGVEQVTLVLPGRAYGSEWRAIRELCRRFAPAIVHTHGYRADLIGGSAARRAGVATVSTVHGFTGGDWKMRVYERLNRIAFRRFDAVVAVSRPLAEELWSTGIDSHRLHLLPNALDMQGTPLDRAAARMRLDVPTDGWRVGWIGRLSAEKGPDVMVHAMARLAGVALSVLGDGPQRDALHAECERLGVSGRITWHGMVPEAARLTPAFDALVLSSRTEGTPMVLLEAMAAGVPVVATRVGGVPDVVSESEALLVPSDDPAALAAAIDALRRDPAAARTRADAARRRLHEERGVEHWLTQYESVYDAAIRVAGPAA